VSESHIITNHIMQVLKLAGERHDHDGEVRELYASVMHAIEVHGDGTRIYHGQPLSGRMMNNLAPWFRRLERRGGMDPVLLNAVGALSQALSSPRPAVTPMRPKDFAPVALPLEYQPAAVSASETTTVTMGDVVNSSVNIDLSRKSIGTAVQQVAAPAQDEPEQQPDEDNPHTLLDPGEEIDAFISYAHKDARWMRRISRSLREYGLGIWTDEGIPVGAPFWARVIEEAIQSSACVVLLMTPNSKKSPYVDKEMACADTYGVPVIPVLCEGSAQTSTHPLLHGVQFTDMRRTNLMPGYSRKLRELAQAVEAARAEKRVRRKSGTPTPQ
jgi:hypothetical protein